MAASYVEALKNGGREIVFGINDRSTALHAAAHLDDNGHVIEELLRNGAKVGAVDKNG